MIRFHWWWFLLVLAPLVTAKSKVKLKDVEVLTLYAGRQTSGRRSSPVSQLSCVEGCMVSPSVVQCYNRGWDGVDVQWECKAEMEHGFRFGKVEVTCEGYDYPDDPYILAGSCGLEYTIEREKGGSGGGGGYDQWKEWKAPTTSSSGFGSLLFMGVVGIVVYAFYKTCIDPQRDPARSRTNDDFSGRPPPPGFRQDYYPPGSGGGGGGSGGGGGFSSGPSDDCHSTRTNTGTGAGTGGGLGNAGGFWTGAATGGLLGYMFGARNNGGYNGGGWTGTRTRSPGAGSSWGSGSWGGGSGGGGGSTRSTSGFGGTRRR